MNKRKNQKEKLISRLAVLFLEISAEEEEINEAVNTAKTKLEIAFKEAKRNKLEKLFDSQIATLKDRDCPEEIMKMLQSQKDTVLQKASKMSFAKGNNPFVPVILRTNRSLCFYDMIVMVRNGKKKKGRLQLS